MHNPALDDYATFERRCVELNRIDSGERISLADAAEFVGLTVAQFCDVYSLFMSEERRKN